MNPIESTLTRLGAKDLRPTPEGFESRCPVCKSKRRSFRVAHVGKNGRVGAFFCHRCGVTGDLVSLLMQAYRMSRSEAESTATDTAGWVKHHRPDIPDDPMGPWEIEPYREVLSDYLVGRGFDPEWIWHYRIGMDLFTNEVVIPNYDAEGKLVGITRRVAEDGALYVHSKFSKSDHVWGLDLVPKDAKMVAIVEGQLDCLGLAPHMDIPVCSTNGSWMSKAQAKLLSNYLVVLAYDNDREGIKGTQRAIRLLRDAGSTETRVLSYPTDDPGDLAQNPNPNLSLVTSIRWLATRNRNTE